MIKTTVCRLRCFLKPTVGGHQAGKSLNPTHSPNLPSSWQVHGNLRARSQALGAMLDAGLLLTRLKTDLYDLLAKSCGTSKGILRRSGCDAELFYIF
jgi:hypothetical protein